MQIRERIPGGSTAKTNHLMHLYLPAKFDALTINPTIFTPICWTKYNRASKHKDKGFSLFRYSESKKIQKRFTYGFSSQNLFIYNYVKKSLVIPHREKRFLFSCQPTKPAMTTASNQLLHSILESRLFAVQSGPR